MNFLSNLMGGIGRAAPEAARNLAYETEEEKRNRIMAALGKTLARDTVEPDRVVVTGAPKAAAPAAEANPFGEFFTSLVGGRPEGGFQDNGVQGAANYLRYLAGHDESGKAYREKIGGIQGGEAAYDRTKAADDLQQYGNMLPEDQAKFDARQALMDPEYTQKYNTARTGTQTYDKSAYDQDRIRKYNDAMAQGDYAAMSALDTDAAMATQGTALDMKSRLGTRVAAAARAMGGDVAANVQRLYSSDPTLQQYLTPEDAQMIAANPDAADKMFGKAPAGINSIATNQAGQAIAVMDDTTTKDLGYKPYVDPLKAQLTQAQIDNYRSQAVNRGKEGSAGSKAEALTKLENNVNAIEGLIAEGERNGAFIKPGTRPEQAAYIRAVNAAQGAVNPAHPPRQTHDKMKSAVSSTMGSLRQLYAASGSPVSSRMMDTEKEWERIAAEVFVEGASADTLRYAISNFRSNYLNPTLAELGATKSTTTDAPAGGGADAGTKPPAPKGVISFSDFMGGNF